jgi:5'-nucleotidase
LYSGQAPDSEKPEGDYPIMVTQPGGKKVPVVQAYAYTKYLGYLHLEFNDEGSLEEIDGTPILLDAKVQRDPDVLELLEKYRPGVVGLEKEIVGVTKVLLDGNCRRNECNMANLIADAFVDWRALNYHSSEFWTDASIALIQGGGVRSSISYKSNNGNISKEDASTVMPFQNKIEIVEVTGSDLLAALEHSVHRYEDGEPRGEFMQFSGVQVVYDINRPSGNRVVDAKVLCALCANPKYEDINLTKKYRIVMYSFLANGGDKYSMFLGKSVLKTEDYDLDVFANFLKKKSPIYSAVERRITIKDITASSKEPGPTCSIICRRCRSCKAGMRNYFTSEIP